MALLAYVRSLLPQNAAVFLFGDCEFGPVEVLEQLERWQCFYVLRHKSDTYIWLNKVNEWETFGGFDEKAGESVWLGHGYLSEFCCVRTFDIKVLGG